MQSAFGTVVIVVSALGIVGAVLALLFGRRTWDGYGKGGLVRDSELGEPAAGGRGPASPGEREEEIRQMLEARNARRRRRGQAELDVEAELGRVDAPSVDPELRAEIRQLVVARNHRRARQGKPPLDVETEVERQIAELGGRLR